jgi:CSLREA domain-containing protein
MMHVRVALRVATLRRMAFALLALTVGVLLYAASGQTTAATFVVTTTADTNDGACTVSLCSLRDAIIAANAGADIITLPAGTYTLTLTGANEQAAATGDLDVTGDLTINGAGSGTTIIDGNATDRVFEVIGAVTLTLNNLTVRNGSTSASTIKSGGGILASGGTVVLSSSVLSGNNGTTGQGGGMLATNATLTNSTVSSNQTSNQGGGIFAGNLTMTSSTVSGNQTPDQGGGIFVSNLTMTNSTVTGNQSTGDQGGGIFAGTVNITGSTISNNQGNDEGGGIFFGGNSTISTSTISGNSCPIGGGIFYLGSGSPLARRSLLPTARSAAIPLPAAAAASTS